MVLGNKFEKHFSEYKFYALETIFQKKKLKCKFTFYKHIGNFSHFIPR